jgi:cellulose synthase/poly-beta-1,6-N-acetylglucosamine synthase-like glycosyltransferase
LTYLGETNILKAFFLVFARDKAHVFDKIKELENLGVQYRIVCGERVEHPNVVYQAPRGKFEAINFGASLIPEETEIVVMNDVDTRIHNLKSALLRFNDEKVALVFGTELVKEGPQNLFFRILNPIRRIIPIAGSGEFMLLRRQVLEEVLPLKPCKAEDTYILFQVLEHGYKTVFCEDSYAETERPKSAQKEESYKRRTVAGIYQALAYTRPPLSTRLFYIILPFCSPLLLVSGEKGYYWMKGILLGLTDYLLGDRTGAWCPTYAT